MYIVIFKAIIKSLDEDYYLSAKRMRELAMKDYGCVQIDSVSDADQEITLSYWNTEEDILAWKNNSEHLRVQSKGILQWYESYRVEIAELKHHYHS